MSKFGLYVVDKTLDNSVSFGLTYHHVPMVWDRSALYFSGQSVLMTNQESNNLGVYISGKRLFINGDSVLTSDYASNVSFDNSSVRFGNTVFARDGLCTNITLENYNRLRAGISVAGYPPYSKDTVYYIIDADYFGDNQPSPNTAVFYDKSVVDGHVDIIYNSFLPELTELHSGTPAKNLVEGDSNFLDPLNVPEISIRPINPIIAYASEGATLEVGYYVDTAEYSSNCQKCIDARQNVYTGVGDTFTTIIENEYGEEVFRRTTFAGQFVVVVPLIRVNNEETDGEPITGKTHISIRTIDNHGRESVTLFYRILVKTQISAEQLAELEELDPDHVDSEGKYIMDEDDLIDYKISTFTYLKNNYDENPNYIPDNPEYLVDPRREYFKGYVNKLALSKLMSEKKAAGYTGIVLYNANTNKDKTLDDSANTVYCFDCHQTRDEDALTPDNYKLADPANYPNSKFSSIDSYYLFYVTVSGNDDASLRTYAIWNPFTSPHTLISPERVEVMVDDKDAEGNVIGQHKDVKHYYRLSQLEDCKIEQGKSVNGHSLGYGETPYEWIRRDGAYVKRDSNGNVLVIWDWGLRDYETPVKKKTEHLATTKALRIKSLNTLLASPIEGNRDQYFAEGKVSSTNYPGAYYYFHHRNFNISNPHPFFLKLPDDFIVDFNYCTLVPTYADDADKDSKFCMLSLVGRRNTHIRNVKIVGIYGDELSKDGYLNSGRTSTTNSFWESGANVRLGGNSLCSLYNVGIENSGGYEYGMGSIRGHGSGGAGKKRIFTFPTETITDKSPSYISYVSGESVQCGVIRDKDGNSLIPVNCRDYSSSVRRYTGPATSNIVDLTYIQDNVTTYSNETVSVSFEDGIIILLAEGGYPYTRSNTSKHPTMFINFYKKVNDEYVYIKTCRIYERERVLLPKEATHASITTYAIYELSNDGTAIISAPNPTEILHPDSRAAQTEYIWSRGLWMPSARAWDLPADCLMDNSYIYVGKASLICGPGVNMTFKDCHFAGASATAYLFNFNLRVRHLEEQCGASSGDSFINCTWGKRRDNMFTSYKIINETMAQYVNLIGCKDLSLEGSMTRYYIKDCKFDSITCILKKQLFNNYLGLVDNTTSRSINSQYDDYHGFTDLYPDTNGQLSSYTDRNVCYDNIRVCVSIRDSLLNIRNNPKVPVYGKNYAHVDDIGTNMVIEETIDKA